jgi:hypothetical protein
MAGFSQTSKTYTEEFPKHLVSLKMTMLPDGTIESGGKNHAIKNLAISTTEIPWEVFEIWALRMDQTTEEQTTGVDATSRPSKPYAAIFRFRTPRPPRNLHELSRGGALLRVVEQNHG